MSDTQYAGDPGRLEVEITAKSFPAATGPKTVVIEGLRLEIAGGKVGALLGPSGCGKTTLLRILAGVEGDYDGSIRLPPGRLGMVFQEPRLLPWRNVEDNIRLAATNIAPGRLDALLESLDLGAHRHHYPGALSLGLARRVALARALAIEPSVLLLDEPFVSLDAALATELRGVLARLVDERRLTVLLVTHDLVEAVELADTVFLLAQRPMKVAGAIAIEQERRLRTDTDKARAIAHLRRLNLELRL